MSIQQIDYSKGKSWSKINLTAGEIRNIQAASNDWIYSVFNEISPLREVESQIYRKMTGSVFDESGGYSDAEAISRFENPSDELSMHFFMGVVEFARPNTFKQE